MEVNKMPMFSQYSGQGNKRIFEWMRSGTGVSFVRCERLDQYYDYPERRNWERGSDDTDGYTHDKYTGEIIVPVRIKSNVVSSTQKICIVLVDNRKPFNPITKRLDLPTHEVRKWVDNYGLFEHFVDEHFRAWGWDDLEHYTIEYAPINEEFDYEWFLNYVAIRHSREFLRYHGHHAVL